jgi:hypothetical protein
VKYQGKPTGSDGREDNARVLRETAARVSGFRAQVVSSGTAPVAGR